MDRQKRRVRHVKNTYGWAVGFVFSLPSRFVRAVLRSGVRQTGCWWMPQTGPDGNWQWPYRCTRASPTQWPGTRRCSSSTLPSTVWRARCCATRNRSWLARRSRPIRRRCERNVKKKIVAYVTEHFRLRTRPPSRCTVSGVLRGGARENLALKVIQNSPSWL